MADDDCDSADCLVELAESLGYEARRANDGEEALAVARAFRPEVLLLDVTMPKISGHDVARTIRAEQWGQRVLMIALTGWARPSDAEESLAAGFDRHLTKPTDIGLLEELLRGQICKVVL